MTSSDHAHMAGMNTPAMQQWQAAKRQYPDAVLLMRVGDFYELYGAEDVAIGNRVLGLTATKRNNGGAAEIPMAGFPHRGKDEQIRRLLAAGHRVAVLEQVEDPALAKGLVRREITDVFTPGVLLEDGLLAASRNNFVASVVADSMRAACAAVDVSTGDVLLNVVPIDQLDAAIVRSEAAELLLPQDATAPATPGRAITRRPGWYFAPSMAMDEIRRIWGAESPEGLGFEDSDALLLRALAGLLSYLREVRPSGIGTLRRPRIDRGGEVLWLDRMTVQNLELVQPLRTSEATGRGTLVSILDETETPMGGRLLRRWILEPLARLDDVNARLDAVTELVQEAATRTELRKTLGSVRDIERIANRVSAGRAGPRELRQLGDSAAELERVKSSLSRLSHGLLGPLGQGFDTLTDIAQDILSTLVETPAASPPEGAVIRAGIDAELDELRSVRDGSQERIAELQERERQATGLPVKVGYNRVHGYYLELTKTHAPQAPERYQRKQTLANAERYVTPELKVLEEKIATAADRIESLEAQILTNLRARIAKHTSRIMETARRLAQLDVLSTLAHVAVRRDYVRPEVHDGYDLRLTACRHPVVEALLPPGEFIANDVVITKDARLVLLTGPNMGGKSTLLRQVGLIQIMAQIGSFVPAREAYVPLCDRVFTRVGASDDLGRGQSTFMVEMTELSAIVHGATEHSLILMDEIGRGTSTSDGVAIAWASVERWHDVIGAKGIFATHYHELTELANALPGLVNRSMAVHEEGEEIVFLHTVVDGPADRSYGIECGRLAGLPRDLLARAREVLETVDRRTSVAPQPAPQKEAAVEHPAIQVLRNLDVDDMTPLQALNLLADLRRLVR